LRRLELKVKQERAKVEEAEETLDKLTVRAPTPGIAIIKKNWSTGNKIQADEEVWRGQSLIGLPDLSSMQATVQVNEVDISKIDTTQEALIRMDAFPDTSFAAKVRDISVLARNKERDSKVKIFDVTVQLTGRDSTMMPGMTVSCEIMVDRIPDALSIPLEALFKQDNQTVAYLKNGSDFKAQPVTIGPANDDYVVITEGLQEGDKVALFDPTRPLVALQGKSKSSSNGR
jgi:RND family efflux transporter MFP subunit